MRTKIQRLLAACLILTVLLLSSGCAKYFRFSGIEGGISTSHGEEQVQTEQLPQENAGPEGNPSAEGEQETEKPQHDEPETEIIEEPPEAETAPDSSSELQTEPEEQTQESDAPAVPPEEEESSQEKDGWMLILVNSDHPLPEDYSVNLKELRNGHHVDERIYPQLQQMFDDARAEGIYPFINESYRTAARQQEIMDKYIAGYEAEGMSHDEAVEAALEIVAVPGTSEHQLGLALDIIAEYDEDSTATWVWLKENCARYGFILRYPAGKEEITGYSYEPWHFRYVGAEAAEEIMSRGITLEEYLAEIG
ncbi:MAG: M15 family metallopeptidase [Oscillospiraceae bacterium]|nr:M15 family metallopeptidase [Oscillospiraceae bacterium]